MIRLCARAGEADAGRKIKYFVRGNMQVSYGQFSALKVAGGLLVNGSPVHANYELRPGDEVCVLLNDSDSGKTVAPEEGEVNIVYEDRDIYIIDKSAPLACQCTPKQPSGTLENRLYARFTDVQDYVFRPLNRLDKGTSGLMAAAKHAHACQLLQKQLHSPAFVREYLAVVEGVLDGAGTIDLPIAKADSASVRRVIDPERGLRAVTHYRTEAICGERTLVRLRLETGRTHQIRVHLAAMGHPICGDFLYGREIPQLPGRFALHSTYLALNHPLTQEGLCFESPLPADLRRLME